ncbi:MAG TPA: translocated intimin receptor Tir [Candidatus Paceibacterota bacterium]|nr:translocated intimin receptor Tir [Verrucomicrobiota bacterium]HRY51090.1 translocated intimin receptor Tir [Candidatus Paceibacterota bacterium]HSA01179.1 translocated intimin receptor Tir [Candidatus Paceibacterota bacterium]
MKDSILKSILTDLHFWVPVVVLIAGITLLFLLG